MQPKNDLVPPIFYFNHLYLLKTPIFCYFQVCVDDMTDTSN